MIKSCSYCINFLYENINWLGKEIKQDKYHDYNYILIDTPGQIEILTRSPEFKKICEFTNYFQ